MMPTHRTVDRREPSLATADAIRYLRVRGVDIGSDTLRMWARTGQVETTRTVGGQNLYTPSALDALVEARARKREARSIA
jgi:hypothetical protein